MNTTVNKGSVKNIYDKITGVPIELFTKTLNTPSKKTEEYRALEHEEEEELKPIRGSVIILAAKLGAVVIGFDLAYAVLLYFLNMFFNFPLPWQNYISISFLPILAIKTVIEVFVLTYLMLSWANTEYFLEGDHLVTRRGILHRYEDVYNFNIIRSVELDQSLLGKIFHYGTIILRVSGFGGYQLTVPMLGIPEPQAVEKIINKHL